MRYTFVVPIRGHVIIEVEAGNEDEAFENLECEGNQVDVEIDEWDFGKADLY
jgi:hypothetical protein